MWHLHITNHSNRRRKAARFNSNVRLMNLHSVNTDLILKILAIIIGVTSIYLVHYFGDIGYYYSLVFYVVLSLIFSFIFEAPPWMLIFITLISNYISGFFFIPGWGQLLPIDLILIIVYWGVIGFICKLGAYSGRKYHEEKA